MTTIERFFGSKINTGLLIIRIVIGMIFFMHGIAKFNMGINETAGFFTAAHIPLAMLSAWIVTLLETFGGLALIVGIGTRLISLLLIVTMVVTLFVVAAFHTPFISTQVATGYELNLALLVALLPTLILGPGRYSLARYIITKEQY